MTAEPVAAGTVGCVLAGGGGVLRVLTGAGPVRASYGAPMLARVARSRSNAPEPGEWVWLRCWADGVVTVEACLGRRAAAPRLRLVHGTGG